MSITEHPEFVQRTIECLGWYYSYQEINFEKLEAFIKSIVIDEPDPELVREIYERYHEAINKTGLNLETKISRRNTST